MLNWEFDISRWKLSCTECVNKILLYSTGNSIQYPVKTTVGKNMRKNAYLYFLVAQMGKNLPAMQGTQAQSLGWEDPLK